VRSVLDEKHAHPLLCCTVFPPRLPAGVGLFVVVHISESDDVISGKSCEKSGVLHCKWNWNWTNVQKTHRHPLNPEVRLNGISKFRSYLSASTATG
jgi:hypothetical protein